MQRSKQHSLSILGVVILVGGCASAAVPNAKVADAQSAISAAEATGAQAVPEASLYLKMAKDGVEAAKQQIRNDENEKAARTLERAKADAELAKSLTTEAKVRQGADQALERIENLQATSVPR